MKVQEPAREGFLYQVWVSKSFGQKQLKTIDGQFVLVLEKGERNLDAGPDFLNALVKLDGQIVRGDIEIHPIAGDWYAHGHHLDPKYNNVVLHVVTMHCPANFKTIKQDKQIVATLNMDEFLDRPAEEIQEEFECANPEKPPGRCALAKKPEAVQQQTVIQFGLERFRIKTERFLERRQLESWDQIFYEALLMSFGYSKNQVPFGKLAKLLPIEKIWNYIWNDPAQIAFKKSEAYLFGVSGLLPFSTALQSIVNPEILQYLSDLHNFWAEFPEKDKINCLKPEEWQFFRLRPQNFPTRRISAAAWIVGKFLDNGFLNSLQKTISFCENDINSCYQEIEKLFKIKANPFWQEHYHFEEARRQVSRQRDQYIIGGERARDISLNIALPVLNAFAIETGDGRLSNIVQEVYNQYPKSAENEITRKMQQRIQLDAKHFLKSSRQQQGLIHLYKNICQDDDCMSCL